MPTYKRWYDHDPLLMEVINLLKNYQEELKAQADGNTVIPDASGIREGFVYRSLDGKNSFKNVSNNFLIKKGQ